MAIQVGGNPSVDQYVTASQMAASQSTGTRQAAAQNAQKKSEAVNRRNLFTDLLHKADSAAVDAAFMEGMPPEIEKMGVEEALSFLMDRVTMAGDELKKSPYGDAFSKYRQKISQFLKFIEKRTYDIEEIQARRSIRNPNPKRKYIIKVVDEKLDQLARDILYNQADQLGLLARVDEINGLLVDLIT